MTPDAAIEAAAEAMYLATWSPGPPKDRTWERLTTDSQRHWLTNARAAIEAAMPAIREALAQEIEADTKDRPGPTLWLTGMTRAARIVRGGTR